MSTELFVILLLGVVVAIYAGMALRTYFRMRGTRVVVCPETDKPAAVEVDAAHAAVTAVWERPELQLESCSRWPERKDCNQACTSQIAIAPQETLEFQMVRRWYEGKNCAICRHAIPELHHAGPRPGLMNMASPTHDIVTWVDIPAESLPAVFETHLPICSNCQVAETFRRQFPNMAIDRPDHSNPGTSVH